MIPHQVEAQVRPDKCTEQNMKYYHIYNSTVYNTQ